MRPRNWNEYTLNPLTRIHWKASQVPAAAVIPAPIAYIKVVAVKKLVVGSQFQTRGPPSGGHCAAPEQPAGFPRWPSPVVVGDRHVYFEKIRVLKAGATPG